MAAPTMSRAGSGRPRPSFRGCCDVLNFFETEDSANRYLRGHPELNGFPISIPDAIEAGRTVFANLLKEP